MVEVPGPITQRLEGLWYANQDHRKFKSAEQGAFQSLLTREQGVFLSAAIGSSPSTCPRGEVYPLVTVKKIPV